MKSAALTTLFVLSSVLEGVLGEDALGAYFYKELGCTQIDGKPQQYNCPDFASNDTCHFKNSVLKTGDRVNRELLKGSCHADCYCSSEGGLSCAHYDCFQKIKPGCSFFKYSLDGCCPVDSICDTPVECKLGDETFKEGQHMYPKDACEVCICDKGFKREAPFCRPTKCFDQATYHYELKRYGAPVFFKGNKCCPSTWTTDEGEKIIQINPDAASESKLFCKYGDRKIQLGHGFEKSVTPYGKTVPLKCECISPPLVICKEK